MKKIIFITILLFTIVCTLFSANAQEFDAAQEADYLAVLAGLFDQHTLQANKEDSQEIKKILHKIRKNYPEVRGINSNLQAEQTQIIVGIKGKYVKNDLVVAPEFIELITRFNGSYEVDIPIMVTIEFPQPLHLPSLFRLFNQLEAVVYAENNVSVFYGIETIIIKKSNKEWNITFNNIGVCLIAGCEKLKQFHFTVTEDLITKMWEREVK